MGILVLMYFRIGYYSLASVLVFIVAGLVLYLGWILLFDKENKEFDHGSGGERHIFLERPPNPT
jgi:hypothetical protein